MDTGRRLRARQKTSFGDVISKHPMHSIPREGVSKESIACYELNRSYHSNKAGGPDFSALIQIPNELTSLRNYFSQVSVIDKGVGNVFDALERTGLTNDTVVILRQITVFHWDITAFGDMVRQPGPPMPTGSPITSSTFWGPGHISAPQKTADHVSSMDLYATLLGFLGLSGEIDEAQIPSRDFSHLLRGEEGHWDNEIYIEQEETRAFRTAGWSYVKRFRGSPNYPLSDELYDTRKDLMKGLISLEVRNTRTLRPRSQTNWMRFLLNTPILNSIPGQAAR